MKYYIYTLTDPIDNDIKYIGKTKDMKDRMRRHMGESNLKDLWIPKNKWIKWLKNQGLKPIMEMLDEGDENNINSLEIYWICQFKTWGYKLKNRTNGGEGVEYWTGKKLSKEHILKKVMNNPRRKDICEYEIGTDKLVIKYTSAIEASRKTGHKPETISNSCKGKTIPGKHGVYWRYKDNYFPYADRNLKHTDEDLVKMKMNHPLRKTICQYEIGTDELIKEWNSSKEIEKEINLNHSNINKCCKGVENYNSAGGFYWRYKDNYFSYKKNLKHNEYKNYIVQQYDINWTLIREYSSSHESMKNGYFFPLIKKSIKNKITYKDYNWKIIEKINNII